MLGSILCFVLLGLMIVTGHARLQFDDSKSPAQIIIAPESTAVTQGETAIFICRVQGNPMPTVSFWRHGEELKERRPKQIFSTIPYGAVLRLKAELSDNGSVIKCLAKNQVGTDSSPATLKVYSNTDALPSGFPRLTKIPSPTMVQVGDSTRITCEVEANPKAKVIWMKQFLPIDQNQQRMKIVDKGSLMIQNIVESDNGLYECVAMNPLGSTISNPVMIHVRKTQYPPAITDKQNRIDVQPNHGANLTCRASGYPTPNVWWMSTTDGITGGNHQITEKSPNQAHLFLTDITEPASYKCVAQNSLGKVSHTFHIVVKQLPKPPTNVDPNPIGPTYAVIRWDASKSMGVDSYTMTLKEKFNKLGSLGRKQIATILPHSVTDTTVMFNVTGLKPFTFYAVEVYAVSNELGMSPPSDVVEFKTAELPPSSPPQAVYANADSWNSVQVNWKAPREPNGRIMGYKVYYSLDLRADMSRWQVTRTHREQIGISDLLSNITYYIKVNAFNAAGDGPVSEPRPIIVTPGVPPQPQNFRGVAKDSTSIQLIWQPPEMAEGMRILDYTLRFKAGSGGAPVTRHIPPERVVHLLSDLKPGTNYHISLAARTEHGNGVAAQTEVKTSNFVSEKVTISDRIGPPTNIEVQKVTTHSAVICWTGPSVSPQLRGSSSVQPLYNLAFSPLAALERPSVVAKGDSFQIPWSIPCYELTRLSPGRRYSVWMWVSAGSEDGSISRPKIFFTSSQNKVPDQPIGKGIKVLSSTKVRIYWNGPKLRRKDIKHYRLQWSKSPYRQWNYTSTLAHQINFDKLYDYELSHLEPNTDYRIRVAAANHRGIGSFYSFSPVRTKGAVPSRPRLLQLADLRRVLGQASKREYVLIKLSWKVPEETYGRIIKYRINWRVIQPSELIDQRTMMSRARRPFTRNVSSPEFQSTEADMIGFGRTYLFEVRAINSNDVGEAAYLNVTMPDNAPDAFPLSLRVTAMNSTTVKMSWSPPKREYRNGAITFYQCRYFEVGKEPTTTRLTNTTSRSIIIHGLREKTFYTFLVRAFTSKGPGPWSPAGNIKTKVELPQPPTEIKSERINERQIKVSWKMPRSKNQAFSGFRILYAINDSPDDPNNWLRLDVSPVTMAIISGLDTTTEYVVRMRTRSEDGRYSELSEPVVARSVVIPAETQMSVRGLACTAGRQDVTVSWQKPISIKDLSHFTIRVMSEKVFKDEWGKSKSFRFKERNYTVPFKAYNSGHSYKVENLEPCTIHDISVISNYKLNFNVLGNWQRTSCQTKMRRPDVVLKPHPVDVDKDSNEITLRLFRSSERLGKIQYNYLVVAPVHLSNTRPDHIDLSKASKTTASSSKDVFVAAKYTQIFFDEGSPSQDFILGKPKQNPTNVADIAYHNKVLIRGQDYKSFVRTCVFFDNGSFDTPGIGTSTESSTQKYRFSELCTSSDWSNVFNTKRPLPETSRSSPSGIDFFTIAIIVIIITLGMVAVICIAVGCFMRRQKPKCSSRSVPVEVTLKQPLMGPPPPAYLRTNDPVEMRRINYQTPDLVQTAAPVSTAMLNHPPVPISHLAEHITRLKVQDNLQFSEEYESIDPGQQFTWEHSNLEVNKAKNRYANVIAYDHSRVILQHLEGQPGSDYVNANYMDGYRKQNAYIATQGPLPETFSDFWRMVWEQRTSLLVMMTRLEERTRIKCDQYWPSRGTDTYDVMMVTHLDTTELAYYTVRTLALQRLSCPGGAPMGERREVRQFQFTGWPDHGVPDCPIPLLMFMRRVRAAGQPEMGPIIVHCSAGVGRTGAFIVIDAMLERIKHEKTVDVYGHVTCLRAQRNYMVQTEDQYIFIHDTLHEAVSSGNTEVPARSLYTHITKLSHIDPASQCTGIELEFKKLSMFKLLSARFISANLTVNKLKNRLVNILPYEASRVCLQPIRGVDGSDYINANFIDGYKSKRAYIATQGPLPETTEDFWRMLWEHNSTIVVMLTKLREGRDKCHQYWPSERSARYQYFVVDPMVEYNMPNFILREFKVTDARDGQSRTVRQFQFTEWPDHGVPRTGEAFIDFIGQVHKTKEQFGQDGPITVHCSAGVGRTGVFLTLSVVLERMRFEGVVDMYQTVKLLRTQRPSIVQSEDQYHFCYTSAHEYLSSFDHYAT